MYKSGLDTQTIKTLREEFSGSDSKIPRPLHSVLLNTKSLNIQANDDQIKDFFWHFTQSQKTENFRQKLTQDFANVLETSETLSSEIKALQSFEDLQALEKKLKRRHRSKAAHARKLGFETPFLLVWNGLHGKGSTQWTELLDSLVKTDSEDHDSCEKVMQMLSALLSEKIIEDISLENKLKNLFLDTAIVKASKSEKVLDDSKFKSFFAFEAPYSQLLRKEQTHRFLTLRRGVSQGELLMTIESPSQELENQSHEYVAPMAHRSSNNR